MQTYSPQPRQQQRGMTLLFGLILLVMLTVIGLVGFRNVTMTERMSGNSADRNVSFQSSESAGKEALQMIETAFDTALAASTSVTLLAPPAPGSVGYFATPLALGAETAFWTGGEGVTLSPGSCPFVSPSTTFNWKSCSTSVGTAYARNNQAAQYVIEMLSAFDDTGVAISLPVTPVTTSSFKYVFRVTTRSTGGSGGAEVVLQTIYTHLNP